MVSEKIRNRLLPIILDKLIELAPGYSGSRISYRDSFRDSLDLDQLNYFIVGFQTSHFQPVFDFKLPNLQKFE